ncbi:flavin-dependent thymidylate synthase [Deltaproteobacteria bacterium]|nr:flavin-dependent thymidylate synthase [Deltaproteobacteria bacterium]
MSTEARNAPDASEPRSPSSTLRSVVPALEARLDTPIPCLDHGFVRVVDYFGDDPAIVQAARVSYGAGTRKVSEDRQLIRYLMRHRHTTPFEMCEIKFHVKLPIFVARQWIRHRTANVNEISGRYSVFTDEFYLPEAHELAKQSTNNKQGRGDALSDEEALAVRGKIEGASRQAYADYEELIHERGLARELGRAVLPVNYYTEWYWKIDLHNLLHFLALRLDPHAQYEIRVFAEAMASFVKDWVPVAWEAFEDYRLGAVMVSKQMINVIQRRLRGEVVTREESGLSKREWEDLWGALGGEP